MRWIHSQMFKRINYDTVYNTHLHVAVCSEAGVVPKGRSSDEVPVNNSKSTQWLWFYDTKQSPLASFCPTSPSSCDIWPLRLNFETVASGDFAIFGRQFGRLIVSSDGQVAVHVVPWDVPPGSMFNPRHDWCSEAAGSVAKAEDWPRFAKRWLF